MDVHRRRRFEVAGAARQRIPTCPPARGSRQGGGKCASHWLRPLAAPHAHRPRMQGCVVCELMEQRARRAGTTLEQRRGVAYRRAG